MKFLENPQNYKKFLRISKKFRKFLRISWNEKKLSKNSPTEKEKDPLRRDAFQRGSTRKHCRTQQFWHPDPLINIFHVELIFSMFISNMFHIGFNIFHVGFNIFILFQYFSYYSNIFHIIST